MARHARFAPGGLVYHALNRGVARLPLFEKPADYAAFQRVLADSIVLDNELRPLFFPPTPFFLHLFFIFPSSSNTRAYSSTAFSGSSALMPLMGFGW